MAIKLLYFAGLREALGTSSESMDLPAGIKTVGELRAHLAARGGKWAEQLAPTRNVRTAVIQLMVPAHAPVKDGDEVAFFPPVTGG
jgi:molybdopterin synthase sulfur carrier subunit